jgi:hypothetical protein
MSFHEQANERPIGEDSTSRWSLLVTTCAACKKFILILHERYDKYRVPGAGEAQYRSDRSFLCYPKGKSRTPLGPEVPSQLADDYREACLTLPDSAKASAALSRGCLQHLLREKAGVKQGNLADEIQQVLDSGKLPSYLADSLDAIRNIGNFAAHPIKSQASGEIIDVEPGEAEWSLNVIESLFDFYFTQPEVLKKKRDALNAKLKEAGKPEMK